MIHLHSQENMALHVEGKQMPSHFSLSHLKSGKGRVIHPFTTSFYVVEDNETSEYDIIQLVDQTAKSMKYVETFMKYRKKGMENEKTSRVFIFRH